MQAIVLSGLGFMLVSERYKSRLSISKKEKRVMHTRVSRTHVLVPRDAWLAWKKICISFVGLS